MTKNITARQREVWAHLVAFYEEHERVPTLTELGRAFDTSVNGAKWYLKALARHGVVTVFPGARGVIGSYVYTLDRFTPTPEPVRLADDEALDRIAQALCRHAAGEISIPEMHDLVEQACGLTGRETAPLDDGDDDA